LGSADDERGGRYAASGSKATVVGAAPISYPTQPSTSPWHRDPVPDEGPLGYCVDEQEPVGELHEQAASREVSVDEPPGAVPEDRPVKFRRRF
jgi:hypothetical protein